MGIVDISPIAPGLYIASRFYPFDPDRVPGAILLDASAVLEDSETFDTQIVEHLARVSPALIALRAAVRSGNGAERIGLGRPQVRR